MQELRGLCDAIGHAEAEMRESSRSDNNRCYFLVGWFAASFGFFGTFATSSLMTDVY